MGTLQARGIRRGMTDGGGAGLVIAGRSAALTSGVTSAKIRWGGVGHRWPIGSAYLGRDQCEDPVGRGWSSLTDRQVFRLANSGTNEVPAFGAAPGARPAGAKATGLESDPCRSSGAVAGRLTAMPAIRRMSSTGEWQPALCPAASDRGRHRPLVSLGEAHGICRPTCSANTIPSPAGLASARTGEGSGQQPDPMKVMPCALSETQSP